MRTYNIIYNKENYRVVVSKHKQAKFIRLRPDSLMKNTVKVTIPRHISYELGNQFALSKLDWVESNSSKFTKVDWLNLEEISILGQACSVKYDVISDCKKIIASYSPNIIKVIIPDKLERNNDLSQHVFDKLYKLIKNLLLSYVLSLCDKICFANNISYNQIRIKCITSKWGSCSNKGNLNFNWLLAFSPLFVINYVVLHEICHLVYLNHSKDFWKMLEDIYNCNIVEAKTWLKNNAYMLYQYQYS